MNKVNIRTRNFFIFLNTRQSIEFLLLGILHPVQRLISEQGTCTWNIPNISRHLNKSNGLIEKLRKWKQRESKKECHVMKGCCSPDYQAKELGTGVRSSFLNPCCCCCCCWLFEWFILFKGCMLLYLIDNRKLCATQYPRKVMFLYFNDSLQ